MIDEEFKMSFKKTEIFTLISNGIAKGDLEKVILGKDSYKITSKYEIEDTIPSQVLIALHILILDGSLSPNYVRKTFNEITVTPDIICLLLSYIDVYLIYRQDHNDLLMDYSGLLDRIKGSKDDDKATTCYKSLMDSIESNVAKFKIKL